MFCLHNRKVIIREVYKGKTHLPETHKEVTKLLCLYFCPKCNRNLTKSMVR